MPWDWTDNNNSAISVELSGAQGPYLFALGDAANEGAELGKKIAELENEYDHIHLIGHSSGGNLISVAAEWIDTLTDSEIHTTYLDPFTPNARYAAYYGEHSDWSDNYSVPDIITSFGLNYTYRELPNAHNVNVTDVSVENSSYVSSSFENGHGWPVQFYLESIDKSSDSSWDGTGYGFSLSREGGGVWPISQSSYPKGNDWVYLGDFEPIDEVSPVFRLDTKLIVDSLASAVQAVSLRSLAVCLI